MDNNGHNSGTTDAVTYRGLTETSVQDLFDRFRAQSPEDSMKDVNAFCLANVFSEGSEIKPETKLEYLKESGRNNRALIKGDGIGSGDSDDGCFG